MCYVLFHTANFTTKQSLFKLPVVNGSPFVNNLTFYSD